MGQGKLSFIKSLDMRDNNLCGTGLEVDPVVPRKWFTNDPGTVVEMHHYKLPSHHPLPFIYS